MQSFHFTDKSCEVEVLRVGSHVAEVISDPQITRSLDGDQF